MKKLDVLLLGWDFLPAVPHALETSCFAVAQTLADRVNLSVLVPQTASTFMVPNVELTGLDQMDLEAIPANRPQPQDLPYANEVYIRRDIPLYGATEQVDSPRGYPGQEQVTGTFASTESKNAQLHINQPTGGNQPNIFGCQDFEELALDAQVIQYARYTTRWAAQRNFDVIYAYNYHTFLAGMELKLVSGKKLLLQVDSLSYERQHPNSKGWMFELEQLALQKSDYILVNTNAKAEILEKRFGISPEVIQSLEEVKPTAKTISLGNGQPANILANRIVGNTLEIKEENSHQTADIIWQVLQKVAA